MLDSKINNEKNCNHPQNKTYRDICNGNTLRCGICHIILTTKI